MNSINVGAAQSVGQRSEQQDAYAFGDADNASFVSHGGVLAVLADGVGGHVNGKDASQTAVRVFVETYQAKPPTQPIADALLHALHCANQAVCALAQQQGQLGNCGTTLAAVVLHGQQLHWISVGDSRVYIVRGTEWAQATVDGNYAQQIARWQPVTSAETSAAVTAALAEETNLSALTSYLGKPYISEIDRNLRPLLCMADDWVLLCSDGLYSALDEADWLAGLVGLPQQACASLLQLALDKNLPTQDNTTVLILGESLRLPPSPPRIVTASAAKAAVAETAPAVAPAADWRGLKRFWPFGRRGGK